MHLYDCCWDYLLYFIQNRAKIVENINTDDITEFYYTHSSSAKPPEHQSYNFYLKDSKYWFYHEKKRKYSLAADGGQYHLFR